MSSRAASVICVPANQLMTSIANMEARMPAILRRRDYETWLRGTPVEAMSALQPYKPGGMLAVCRESADQLHYRGRPRLDSSRSLSGTASNPKRIPLSAVGDYLGPRDELGHNLAMAILSVHTEARAVAAWSIPVQALPVINPARIWIPPAERREITDEELELIEMRLSAGRLRSGIWKTYSPKVSSTVCRLG